MSEPTAQHPSPAATRTMRATELVDRATRFLVDRGAPQQQARLQAEHLVEAELRGHPSHGLRRLRVLGARVENGLIVPGATPTLDWVTDVVLRVDGQLGFGPVAAYAALDELLSRADSTGLALAAMHRTHHLGMLAPYLEHAVERDAIAIVLSSTEGLVHPWGGAGALVGTNPIGIGVPSSDGHLILDMSTGITSAGRILDHRDRGLELPEGWAVDAEGTPTTDAAAAAEGAISPFGGAKGYGLAIAFGAIIGSLTTTALGADVHGTLDTEHATTKGDVLIVCNPALIAGADARETIGAYFAQLRESAAPGRTVTVPGDRARSERARRLAEGVEVAEDLFALLDTPAT